jgi:hypothetical protein
MDIRLNKSEPVVEENPGNTRASLGTKVRRKTEKSRRPQLPGKFSFSNTCEVTVPQTDTGRWGENPKALVRTLVQELGKMYP